MKNRDAVLAQLQELRGALGRLDGQTGGAQGIQPLILETDEVMEQLRGQAEKELVAPPVPEKQEEPRYQIRWPGRSAR